MDSQSLQILGLVVTGFLFHFAWLPSSVAKVRGLGIKWAASNRSETDLSKVDGWGQRAERAHNNFKEGLPGYLIAALALIFLKVDSSLATYACLLFPLLRTLHFVSYSAGIVKARALFWFAATFAVLFMYAEVFRALFS